MTFTTKYAVTLKLGFQSEKGKAFIGLILKHSGSYLATIKAGLFQDELLTGFGTQYELWNKNPY
jgi:hypothetical protein